MTTTRRDPFSTSDVHGGNRRPEREHPLDLAAIAEWNAANKAAREMYRRMPLAKGVVQVPR